MILSFPLLLAKALFKIDVDYSEKPMTPRKTLRLFTPSRISFIEIRQTLLLLSFTLLSTTVLILILTNVGR